MFVITFNEHITALEGVGEDSVQGPRTGKVDNQIITLFQDQKEAEKWCRQCQKKWCPANEKDKEVLTFWYEIWDYPVLNSVDDDRDATFIIAYNRYGKKIDTSWVVDGRTALNSEPKKRVRKAARKTIRKKVRRTHRKVQEGSCPWCEGYIHPTRATAKWW